MSDADRVSVWRVTGDDDFDDFTNLCPEADGTESEVAEWLRTSAYHGRAYTVMWPDARSMPAADFLAQRHLAANNFG